MDTLMSLKVFVSVADLRSFAAASEKLDILPAMATKHLQHLEGRVGARLLNRTSRSVSLTEAGSEYLARARSLLEGLDDIEVQLQQGTQEPKGTLKASLPVWMANKGFAKVVAAYRAQFPKVILDLDFSGRMVNLVGEGFDLALRATFALEEGLIARKLADIRFCLVGSPGLLKQLGTPAQISDLVGLPIVAYGPVMTDGRVKIGSGTSAHELHFNPVLKSSNETMLYLAALEGVGLAFMPWTLVEGDIAEGRLIHILPQAIAPTAPLHAVYPNRSYLPAKVRSFLDYLAKALA